MTTPLDPRTLRWVVRRLRKTQRECEASEARFRKNDAEAAEFFGGFAASAMHEADDLLKHARAIEKRRTKKAGR